MGYKDGGLYMTVYNRKGLSIVYQSVGFLDYGTIPLGSLREGMFMTISVGNDPKYKTYLTRVVFELDPNNGDLL